MIRICHNTNTMQPFTQKYTIVSFIDKINEDDEFSAGNWPMHLTLAATFSIQWDVYALIRELAKITDESKPIQSNIIQFDNFGPKGQVPVALVKPTNDITNLHFAIIDVLKMAGAVYNDPQYNLEGYRPHVTITDNSNINIGDELILNNLALIDMFPGGNQHQRKVLKIQRFN